MNSAKFKIGDRVAVLDDTIKGIIIAINGRVIDLEDENGFCYSYQLNEIVLVADQLFSNLKVKIKDKDFIKQQK